VGTVSLRRVNARLVLPHPVERAVVLPGSESWIAGLEAVGVHVTADPSAAQLAVAPSRLVAEALATGAAMLIVEGRGAGRTLRRAGFAVERLLPLPSVEEPDVLLPLDRPSVARYALSRSLLPSTRLKELRNRAVATGQGLEFAGRLRSLVTVGAREPGPPFLVAAAEGMGVSRGAGWFLASGQGDRLSRGLFQLFPPGSHEPAWALKFAAVPGYAAPFERDQRGLELVAGVGGVAAARAPRLLGRFSAGGIEASLETAAVGSRLVSYLRSSAPLPARTGAVDAIAAWVVEVETETAGSEALLADERHRLIRDVLPHWSFAGVAADLVERLPPVPAVLQHDDLGTWNLVIDGGGDRFTVLDWEGARRFGFPVWDLWYFLADAFAVLDGAVGVDAQEEHFAQLFRGELPWSERLFGWTRRAAEALALPATSVGPLAMLCWLHHGVSHLARADAVELHAPGSRPAATRFERLARRWLRDPLLGPAWPAWRQP